MSAGSLYTARWTRRLQRPAARQESLRPLRGMLPFPRHAASGWIWEHRPAEICNALSERLNDHLRGPHRSGSKSAWIRSRRSAKCGLCRCSGTRWGHSSCDKRSGRRLWLQDRLHLGRPGIGLPATIAATSSSTVSGPLMPLFNGLR